MEQDDVGAERVGEAFQSGAGHAVVGQSVFAHVVVKAIDVGCHGIVGRRKTGVCAVGRENLVVADTLENVVEVTELVGTIGDVVLDGLTREGVEVRIVDFLPTTVQPDHHDCGHDEEELSDMFSYIEFHNLESF